MTSVLLTRVLSFQRWYETRSGKNEGLAFSVGYLLVQIFITHFSQQEVGTIKSRQSSSWKISCLGKLAASETEDTGEGSGGNKEAEKFIYSYDQ